MSGFDKAFLKMQILKDDLRLWEKKKMTMDEFEIRADNIRNSIFDMGHVNSGMISIKSKNKPDNKLVKDHFYPRKQVGRLLLKISNKLTNQQIFKILKHSMMVHTITKKEHSLLNKFQKQYPYNWQKAYKKAGIVLDITEDFDHINLNFIYQMSKKYNHSYQFSNIYRNIEISSDSEDDYDINDPFIDNDNENNQFNNDDYIPETESDPDSEEYNTYDEEDEDEDDIY